MVKDIERIDWRITGVDVLDDGNLLFVRIEAANPPPGAKQKKLVTLVSVEMFVTEAVTRILANELLNTPPEGDMQ